MAHILSHTKDCLVLNVEDLVKNKDVWMSVQIEHFPDFIHLTLEVLKVLRIYLGEMELAHDRPFIFKCAKHRLIQQSVIYKYLSNSYMN